MKGKLNLPFRFYQGYINDDTLVYFFGIIALDKISTSDFLGLNTD